MIFYILLCNILFIPIIFCSNNTVSKSEVENKTVSDTHHKKLFNETKVALLSEGGSILPETLDIALPKSNDSLANLSNGKNKVVPRKGVVYSENSTKPEEISLPINDNSTSQTNAQEDKSKTLPELLKNTTSVIHGKSTLLDNISKSLKNVSEPKTPKKPLILHSDVLENMTVKSSPGTLVNQVQSPNKDVKSYLTNVNNHPGMVMPIVITILLVPMFAVLGYMALRRGQEAWKNRHYKRMDFLLDGMYND